MGRALPFKVCLTPLDVVQKGTQANYPSDHLVYL